MEDKDIKILETVINYRKIDGIFTNNEVIFKAIEKLLQAYKQYEKIINEMAIELCNRDFAFDYDIADEDLYDGIIDYFRKQCK